jgi:ubiquitin-conjugating enzyme E2 M
MLLAKKAAAEKAAAKEGSIFGEGVQGKELAVKAERKVSSGQLRMQKGAVCRDFGLRPRTPVSLRRCRAAPSSPPPPSRALPYLRADIAELDQFDYLEVVWPNEKDVMNSVLHVRPRDGYWKGACVSFKMEFSHDEYPIKAPKVTCITKLYHPNISLEGAVCLSMLKERHQNVNGQEDGWKPVNTLTSITFGVLALFMEPNPDDPLHIRAFALPTRPPPHSSAPRTR